MTEKRKVREDANTMRKKQMYDLRLAALQENTRSTTKSMMLLNRISKYVNSMLILVKKTMFKRERLLILVPKQ